jgi:molecular chaperone GrpE
VREDPEQLGREPGEPPAETPEAEGQTPVWELEARLAAADERLLRALADLDNQRKRMARELERARAEARNEVLRDVLDVADSADRGLAVFADRADDPVMAGLAAVAEQIDEVLRRHGVERLGAVGEPFDPELHEAVATTPSGDLPAGSIAAVTRPGYAVDGRLLRPAQVAVARAVGDGG